MLRWMAPFLSFTAEEAWAVLGAAGKTPAGTRASIFMDTYAPQGAVDGALLAKWSAHPRDSRRGQQGHRGAARRRQGRLVAAGQCDARQSTAQDHALLASLGDDLKFVFITSAVELMAGERSCAVQVQPSTAVKCERCWHYRDDVGHDPAHPTICGRCTSNLLRRRRSPDGGLMAKGKTSLVRSSGGGMLPWLGLALIILIADQFTKVLILGYYQLGDSTAVTSFFNIVRVHNTGAAFSFLAVGRGLAALVLHRPWRLRRAVHRVDAQVTQRPKAVQLCHGLHPGRRGRQRDRPGAVRLRGRLPGLPLARHAFPGVQRGRQRHHHRRELR